MKKLNGITNSRPKRPTMVLNIVFAILMIRSSLSSVIELVTALEGYLFFAFIPVLFSIFSIVVGVLLLCRHEMGYILQFFAHSIDIIINAMLIYKCITLKEFVVNLITEWVVINAFIDTFLTLFMILIIVIIACSISIDIWAIIYYAKNKEKYFAIEN